MKAITPLAGNSWANIEWKNDEMEERTHTCTTNSYIFHFVSLAFFLCCDEDFIWHLFVEPS